MLSAMETNRRWLIAVVCILVLLSLPVRILVAHSSPSHGFLSMIRFGEKFKDRALPEIQELSGVWSGRGGYDGQFYAQLALRPALNDEALDRALDNPSYRARRIGLPFLAYCLGAGKSASVLQIYALLNVAFWLLLLAAIMRFIGYTRPRDLLLAAALLWTTGTLTSVARALTDLPAVVLGVLAIYSSRRWVASVALLATGGLFKETAVLCFAAAPWRKESQNWDVKRLAMSFCIVMAPLALWLIYVHFHLPGSVGVNHNFTWPLVGLAQKLGASVHDVATGWGSGSVSLARLFEVLCPLSLVVQALYLIARPRMNAPAWRFGIAFVLLLIFLSDAVWVKQFAYSRVLLPLTFSFNLLIHEYETGARYATLFALGNLGMCYLLFGHVP